MGARRSGPGGGDESPASSTNTPGAALDLDARGLIRSSEAVGEEETGALGRRERKLAAHGKDIVATLYMLVRNVKMHAPDNQVFSRPIERLRETVNIVIAEEKSFDLRAVGTRVYINDIALRFDFAALENVTALTRELETRGVGGFASDRPITSQDIRDFLMHFTAGREDAIDFDDPGGRAAASIRIQRFAHVKELLDKFEAANDVDERIDRKKYLLTVYARCTFLIRTYFERMEAGDCTMPLAKAARLVRELIDLSYDAKSHFLGATTTRCDEEYLVYHSVNCALLAIVFGVELGLDKRQLHDLGMAALFSQVGFLEITYGIAAQQGPLNEEQRTHVDLCPLRTARRILAARGLDRAAMQRIVATYESKIDYAIPRRTAAGDVELVVPRMEIGPFGRIIAIVDCYDALTSRRPFREALGAEIALALMGDTLRYRFDPVLLRVFMKVMAIQPIKILDASASTVRIG